MERCFYLIIFFVVCSCSSRSTWAEERTPLTATQWVSADSSDCIRIRVEALQSSRTGAPVSKARVTLIGPNDFRRSSATDSNGLVEFKGVAPGVYATMVWTGEAFGCLSLHVVDRTLETQRQYTNTASMPIGSVSASQFSRVVEPHLPTFYPLESLKIDSSRLGSVAEQIRDNEEFAIQRIEGGFSGVIFQPTDHGGQRDEEDVEESLDPSEFANVFLYQDGKRIRHTLTGQDGRFYFKYVNPGVYTLVSVGSDGIGCMAFELCDLAAETGQAAKTGNYRFVARRRRVCRRLAMQVVPCCEPVCKELECCPVECCEVVPAIGVEAVGAPGVGALGPGMGGFGAAGAGFGAGGGFGGGGGIAAGGGGAAVAGLAAATLIVAGTEAEGEGPFSQSPPASPDNLRH